MARVAYGTTVRTKLATSVRPSSGGDDAKPATDRHTPRETAGSPWTRKRTSGARHASTIVSIGPSYQWRRFSIALACAVPPTARPSPRSARVLRRQLKCKDQHFIKQSSSDHLLPTGSVLTGIRLDGQCPIKSMRLRCKDRDRHSPVIGCSAANACKLETGRSTRARQLALSARSGHRSRCKSTANGASYPAQVDYHVHITSGEPYGLLWTRPSQAHAPTVDVWHCARFCWRYARRWSISSWFNCRSADSRNNLRSPRRPSKVYFHRRPHPWGDNGNHVEGAAERRSREGYASGITGGGVSR